MLTAHYFNARRKGDRHVLVIGEDGKIHGEFLRFEMPVEGKREARQATAEHDAACWNF